MNKIDIKNLSKQELLLWINNNEVEAYRANQILKWVYAEKKDSFSLMSNLPIKIRELLDDNFVISRLVKEKVLKSNDETCKYLFRLNDGLFIETVLIPEKDHYTLCVSSQVGCAQNCAFCLTGKNGFFRNLEPSEIINQVMEVLYDIPNSSPKRLTNIVFMGMGEPLANYKNLVKAIEIIVDSKEGLNFSTRRVTVSTAGLVPLMEKLGNETKINLAVSLNASDDETRNTLMPINQKYPLDVLIEACKGFPLPKRRRITFEYILIKDVNDSDKDAERLVKLLRTVKAKINLIPFNEHLESPFKRPDESRIFHFQEILAANNYTVIIRNSKGQDISAACGQLSTQEK
ncbi:MAG: 23S rRNA (adenine(2503)-C(2))-methyltransferase RlmN [Desulfobacterales bacterium]|nr:23S rRNA (adenine(2503)-C(2))-methyltransferase RlmN [Desulfobacterales bacterium]